MAIVINPALSSEASGNLGGICYSRIRSTKIARAAWTGTVPNTPDQVVYQVILTTVTQDWGGTLSQAQRDAWKEAAKSQVRINRLQQEYSITGYSYYVEVNMRINAWGKPSIAMPPSDVEPLWIKSLELQSNATGFIKGLLTFHNLLSNLRGVEWFIAGPYASGGRHALKNEYRIWHIEFGFSVSTKSLPGYVSGKYYWLKVRGINDSGIASNYFEDQILVV